MTHMTHYGSCDSSEPVHGFDGEHVVVGVDADVVAGVDDLARLHGGGILALLRSASDVVVEDNVRPTQTISLTSSW